MDAKVELAVMLAKYCIHQHTYSTCVENRSKLLPRQALRKRTFDIQEGTVMDGSSRTNVPVSMTDEERKAFSQLVAALSKVEKPYRMGLALTATAFTLCARSDDAPNALEDMHEWLDDAAHDLDEGGLGLALLKIVGHFMFLGPRRPYPED